MNPRRISLTLLSEWEKERGYIEILLSKHTQSLNQRDSAFIRNLTIGIIKNLYLLDYQIDQNCHLPKKTDLRNILRIGAYQLQKMRIPPYATINETVSLVHQKRKKGFINATLRSIKKYIEEESSSMPSHILYSHPKWLVEKWEREYGKEKSERLMIWNNSVPKIYFRKNSLNPSDSLDECIRNQNYKESFKEYFISPEKIKAEWLQNGNLYIQDPSTSFSIDLLRPLPEEKILDACAAPGGKSFLISLFCKNKQNLFITDLNEKRLLLIKENAKKLRFAFRSLSSYDWTETPQEKWRHFFDGILLDVPCSNTGVLQRRVDARWRLNPQNLQILAQTQLKILENAKDCLNANGRIVYSTCSLEAEENEGLIEEFLQRNPSFEVKETRKSHPLEDEIDGTFACLLVKKT